MQPLTRVNTYIDLHELLAVHLLARVHVEGNESILLATGNENTFVPVGLNDDLGTSTEATSATATACAIEGM